MTVKTPITPTIICFGEVLWDCLPNGLFLGGAPFNVTYHLKQQRARPFLVSSVGEDFLGEEILLRMAKRNLSTEFVQKNTRFKTGAVRVKLDDSGDAQYDILRSVAWDHIEPRESWKSLSERADAIIFGSLSLRSSCNKQSLETLFGNQQLCKIFDVNIRPGFDDKEELKRLSKLADWQKLNLEEMQYLSGVDKGNVKDQLSRFCEENEYENVCLTCGGEGAYLYMDGDITHANAPKTNVKDTVGAGDSFMATLSVQILNGKLEKNPQSALNLAVKVGSYVASQEGAQPEYPDELIDVL